MEAMLPRQSRAPRAKPKPDATDARREAAAEAELARSRGRPQIKTPPNAGFLAKAVLKPILPPSGLTLKELTRRWPEIVGEQLGKLTSPEKLSESKEGVTLTLIVAGPAAPFVQHQQALILERCNLAGLKAIKLAIKQGQPAKPRGSNLRPISAPLSADEERALAAALAPIEDPQLKRALARLGRAVAGRKD
jgi:hypothetical protein